METQLKCKHCQSTKIHAIDNLPLDHTEDWLKEAELQVDSEIYIEFKCDDCNKNTTHTMDIIPRVKEEQEDSVTVFKKKLEAFAKAAEELDNAWDQIDGHPEVTKALSIRWPFLERLYYLALRDTKNWAMKTVENLNKL